MHIELSLEIQDTIDANFREGLTNLEIEIIHPLSMLHNSSVFARREEL